MFDHNVDTTIWQRASDEAKAFYERMATAFVSAASQAKELETVSYEVQSLVSRVTALEEENRKLRSDLSETWEFARRVEAERDIAKRDLEQAQLEVLTLQDTVNTRDASIATLTGNYNSVVAERDNANAEIARLNMALADARAQSDYWRDRSRTAEDRATAMEREVQAVHTEIAEVRKFCNDLEERLARVRSVLSDTVEKPVIFPSLVG